MEILLGVFIFVYLYSIVINQRKPFLSLNLNICNGMFMEINSAIDLFKLSTRILVSKKNLFDLIQFSKVENSVYWAGCDYIIGNTPQQGINWIGQLPKIKGVIVKVKTGIYKEDGWLDNQKIIYHYSFKTRNEKIIYTEKANAVLINQPQYLYPIFLFTDAGKNWHYEGTFSIAEIEETYVVLKRFKDLEKE